MLPPYLSCSLYATATINTDLHYTKRSQTIFGYIDLNERNTIFLFFYLFIYFFFFLNLFIQENLQKWRKYII